MANEVSIKVSADAKAAVADFKRLTDQIHLTEAAARKAGAGFQAMGSAAEHSLGRIAAKANQARREIEQMHRAQASGGPQFGAATGRGFGGGVSGGASFLAGGGGALIGGAVLTGAYAVGNAAYDEARAQAQSQTFLANASKQAGQAFAYQSGEAAKLRRELGLTTAQATQLQAASLRFTSAIGRPGEARKLAGALGNALAASGRSSDEIPNRIQQLQTGQDELFDVLGPVKIGSKTAGSPEQIYKAYASEIMHVKRELTDLEKMQARYYAVLQAGAAAEGAAAARMQTNIGKIDQLKNSLSDLAGQLGTSVVNSAAFTDGLSTATRTVNLLTAAIDALAAAEAKRGGSSGSNASGIGDASGGGGDPITQGYRLFKYGLGQWEDAQARAQAGPPGSLAKRFDRLAGGIGSTFGLDIGNPLSALQAAYQAATSPAAVLANAQRYLGPGSSVLDNPLYSSRDPFGWQSVGEQNAGNSSARIARLRQAGIEQAHQFAPGIVSGVSSAYSSIIGAGDKLAGLSVSGETAQARAARVFSLSGSVARDAAEAYRLGGYGAAEAASMSEAEARRFRIATLGNVAPGELSADQEAAYRDDLQKYQEDQLKQARETLLEAVRMRKALEKIAGKLVPDEPVEAEPITIQLDNRADVVARFSLIANGDSLRGEGPRGDF